MKKSIDKEKMFVYNYLVERTKFLKKEIIIMKMKIVNKKKFVRSMMMLIGLVILIVLGLITTTTYSKTEIGYKEDYVLKGDTLWSIAEQEVNQNEYYKNKDIREVMYEIRQLNHITNDNLEIGQKIIIPNL